MTKSPTIRSMSIFVFAIVSMLYTPTFAETKADPKPGDPGFVEHVMTRIDDLYRGNKSHGVMEMRIKTKHWKRTMKMESWSLGTDYSLVRILKPRKERGTATLKAKKNLFIYLNKTGRTIKITSGMMGGSWMGSHFTNDDLVRHSRLSRDYVIKLAFSGDEGGNKVYRFELKAKPDAPVVWDKQVITVKQTDLQPLSQAFYDEDGKKVRVMTFSKHATVDGRTLPFEMIMTPQDGSGEYTAMEVKKIKFDVSLSKSFFSLQKLKSM